MNLLRNHTWYIYSLPVVKDLLGLLYQGQQPIFYERKYIAEYNGERAGLLVLKFQGDPEEKCKKYNFRENVFDLYFILCPRLTNKHVW